MDSGQWKQLDSLFHAISELPLEERDTFLMQACGGDQALERELRSLLASQQAAREFLETPVMELAAQSLANKTEATEEGSTGPVATGATFDQYVVLEKLGSGGMGVVWKARDKRLNRFVALKFLPGAMTRDPERKRRFAQEARVTSALNHTNIVTIYEIGQSAPDGCDFIVMEFVPGWTLGELIRSRKLRLKDALQYAIQIADALVAAHAVGIVHRDLKPGNVMVTDQGLVKVLDFGLAKLTGQGEAGISGAQTTVDQVIAGTVSFMSPEQSEGRKVDTRSDIFSFGAILYEMVTATRAFAGDSNVSIQSAILRDEPKPAREIVEGLPRELDRIICRCLRKDANRRYQHAGDLRIDLQQVSESLDAGNPVVPDGTRAASRAPLWRWLAATTACVAASMAVTWCLRAPPAAPRDWKLARLTNGPGLSTDPALSPDGKLLAYASDGGRDSGLDLYVKQVTGGQPIRLTSDGAGNRSPNFSPDGNRIVFRSDRDGGGIYEIPALGGEIRLLARGGFSPAVSPDGSKVAFWTGSAQVDARVPGNGAVWVVSTAGGQPQRVGSSFTAARTPIWSPDGKRLLFVGYTSSKTYESSALDWWLATPDGGETVRTGMNEALVHAGLAVYPLPRPGCWSIPTNSVIFSTTAGDASNIWEIRLSPRTGKVSGDPWRLTAGANENGPSCASTGVIVFHNAESRRDIWSSPFDLDRGKPTGALDRITRGLGVRLYASLSSDGRYLAYASDQSGQITIWKRDLAEGTETVIARLPLSKVSVVYPAFSPFDGRIAFTILDINPVPTYVEAPGGELEKVGEGWRTTDWSRDGKVLLTFAGDPYQVNLFDLATRRQIPLLKHPTYNMLYARFSPDNRWVAFTSRVSANRGRITIAPIDGPRPVPESAWITIAEEGIDEWPGWSADGRTVYFTSRRDGHSCLWGQPIDPVSHRPVGDAFAALHIHGRATYRRGGWSASGGRIAMTLTEEKGDIWLMSRTGPK